MVAWGAETIQYAGVAQSVEQRIRNAQVGGSSPFTSSNVPLDLFSARVQWDFYFADEA